MTMLATPDVNQQFATERAAQFQAAARAAAAFDQRIAHGKLTPIGNGRYRVTDPGSWDNGEVLVRRNGQILPQHGLDMSTGNAALYSTTPAWHSLGSIVPAGTPDIDTVLMGARSVSEVEQNVAAANKGPLPAEILHRLDEIAAMVPFRPFEEPFGCSLGNKDYRGPGVAR